MNEAMLQLAKMVAQETGSVTEVTVSLTPCRWAECSCQS